VRVPIRLGSTVAVAALGLAAAAALPFAPPALASTARASASTARASASTAPALASTAPSFAGTGQAVFVQTDNPSGNQVVAYHRAPDGVLNPAGTYDTGGLGGILAGSVVDHLASQGSLSYDPWHALLYAVNAGSDTVSVFAVHGDRLALRQVLGSGGSFPVSVATRGDLVYVLNALGGGRVQGYRVLGGALVPIPGSGRALGLDPTASPQFTNTPGQVAFTPDGSQLIVTTKDNGNDIDVFGVRFDGLLSAAPAVNPEPGTVPFAISFDPYGHLVIAESGTNALATFALAASGTVSLIDAVPTGASATCWVASAGPFLFASNAGSASESGYASSSGGTLTLLGAAPTDPGTVDAAAAAGGRFLYVQTGGSGIVDEFAVGAGGNLTEIGAVTVPGAAGGEGIVAL
jgi:6-phosphogluconolactonase (cycloisomerase 2 family)